MSTVRHRATRALVAAALVLTTSACGGDDGTASGPPATTSGPATSVAGLDGGTIELAKAGSPTVVAFIASWCVPCRRELPELERTAAELGDRARFVAVAVQEEPAQTKELVADTGITFPVGNDPDGVVLEDYGFTGLPGTLVLDGSGKVLHRYQGTIDFEDLRRRLGAPTAD